MSSLFALWLSQDHTNGCQPRSCQSLYTIPHRETVAGEATARSSTSNNNDTWSQIGYYIHIMFSHSRSLSVLKPTREPVMGGRHATCVYWVHPRTHSAMVTIYIPLRCKQIMSSLNRARPHAAVVIAHLGIGQILIYMYKGTKAQNTKA